MKTRSEAAEALLDLGWTFAEVERVLKSEEQMRPAIFIPTMTVKEKPTKTNFR